MGQRTPAKRDRGKKDGGYVLHGGIPWPTLGDGTPYTDSLTRVRHRELEDETGKLQWVEWCHPEGDRMPESSRMTSPTKSFPEGKAKPGEWWCVVSWDRRDEEDSLLVRHLLANIVPE